MQNYTCHFFFFVFIFYLIIFPKNYINDKKGKILDLIISIGVLFLFLGLFLEEILEIILTLTGASFLIFAHYRNHISTKLTKDIGV